MTKAEFENVDGLLDDAGDHILDVAKELRRLGWDDWDARWLARRVNDFRSDIAEGFEKLEQARSRIRER